MQSDNLDKKIIEAAANHHPSYDGDGWKQMEKLLDKHLPQQKEKKRRFIFFILFFLLLGGAGLWYFFRAEPKTDRQVTATVQAVPENIQQPSEQKTGSAEKQDQLQTGSESNADNNNIAIFPVVSPVSTAVTDKKITKDVLVPGMKKSTVFSDKTRSKKIYSTKRKEGNTGNEKEAVNPASDQTGLLSNRKADKTEAEVAVIQPFNKQVESVPVKNGDVQVTNIQTDTSTQAEKETAVNKKEKAQKKKSSYFFLTLSGGPDLSFAGGEKAGTTKLSGGFGLGYQFKNGLSLRTGLYTGRKVYSATGGSYNPPPVFFQYYPVLENVDANCKVYEIPVSVSYHFGKSEKQNWFAGAGISTLLMKKEDYTYTYKYNTAGPSYISSWSVSNKNKHFFSVLTLSGGYQHRISNRVSIAAEPYLKLPLQGVGYGKVKLNSTGVLFHLSVAPFQSRIKK